MRGWAENTGKSFFFEKVTVFYKREGSLPTHQRLQAGHRDWLQKLVGRQNTMWLCVLEIGAVSWKMAIL
jgi:hypothetical protein